jgi:hypothetical protein
MATFGENRRRAAEHEQILRRLHPREDDLSPGMGQRYRGYTVGDRIDETSEPRVRMDIQTAVQITSLSDQPLGLVELLTESAPVHLDPLDGPAEGPFDNVISNVVTTGTRWRDALAARVRMARQVRETDWPAYERRRENRIAYARDTQLMRILGWSAVVLAMGALIAGAMLVAGIVTQQ